MNYNNLSDISFLQNLINLSFLKLQNNNITDIKTLVDNAGIDSGDNVYLETNPLSDIS